MIGHVSPRRREEFIDFVQALNVGDPAQLADVLAAWSTGSGVPRERIQIAADRLIARHGGSRIVLNAIVGDFLPLLRDEGMTMPPDLLLIFKALVTVDGVLSRIEPGFDLSVAMQRSSLRIAKARLTPEYWAPTLRALAWELSKASEDAPRLLRAAVRRLEADQGSAVPDKEQAAAIASAARWIAGAVIAGAALIAISIFFS